MRSQIGLLRSSKHSERLRLFYLDCLKVTENMLKVVDDLASHEVNECIEHSSQKVLLLFHLAYEIV